MGMVVQHNISAMNANEAMRKNVAGLKKQTEKLSTGYNINRAADNAAGLAISEKMRSQIRGLSQATANSNDAISLIQTAEGGLQETEDILQRMRELSVQSANGTYTDEDREQIQYEVDALKSEVDRISSATEYNEMKLLDGSLSGGGTVNGEYGAKYGKISQHQDAAGTAINTTDENGATKAVAQSFDGAVITSNVGGAGFKVTNQATKGGESATWEQDGKTLTLNLEAGKTYTQEDIDKLIANADTKKADGVVADMSIKLDNGVFKANATANTTEYSDRTVAGVRAESTTVSLLKADTSTEDADVETKTTALNTAIEGLSAANAKSVSKALGLTDGTTAASNDDIKAAIAAMDSEALDELANNTDAASIATEVGNLKTSVQAQETAASSTANLLTSATTGYGDQIKFTSNSYGVDTRKFGIATDVAAGKEYVDVKTGTTGDTTGNKDGEYTIHLSTGVEYSNDDIEKLMAKAGLDYTVEITDSKAPDGDVKMKLDMTRTEATAKQTQLANGAGVGKEETGSTGKGLTFQIGANGVEDQRLTVNVDDMSSKALGVNNISVAKQDDANAAINKIDDAIKAVSTQRAKLGAVQNRLEHTVNSLNTANENLSASESQIRDTDMAAEMIKYTKSNILQQASQSMLAQANQQPQGVLQLLG